MLKMGEIQVMLQILVGATVVLLSWHSMSFMSVCADQTVDILSPLPQPKSGDPLVAASPAPGLGGDIIGALPPMFLHEPLPLIPNPGVPASVPSVADLDPPSMLTVPPPAPLAPVSPQTPSFPLEPIVFDYSDGEYGPAHWGDLKSEWSLCKTGIAQSPLAITPNIMITDPNLGDLDATYTANPVNATISNNGHGVQVEVSPDVGVLKIYNVTYRPKEFHFHTPSEHQILNYRFPMELHIVHQSLDNKTAVVSVLFVYGVYNPFLAQFFDKLPSYTNPGVKTDIGRIKLLKLERNYGRYRGSLTTPPCTEKVIWTLMLWDMDNARPTSFPSRGRKFHINHTPKWMNLEKLKSRMFMPTSA